MTKLLLNRIDYGRRRTRSRPLQLIVLATVMALLGLAGPARATATMGTAAQAVHEAAGALEVKVESLSRQSQLEVGTEVHFLARSAERMLDRLARETVAAASAGLEEDLLFLRDLLVAAGTELDRLAAGGGRPAAADLRRLVGAADERVRAIERAFERRAAALEGAVVRAEQTAEGLVLHTIDRSLYEGVRLGGLGLALLGLLVVGMRLLSLGEAEMSIKELIRQSPLAGIGGMLAIVVFLVASVSIAVDPRAVTALVERAELQPAPAACERLDAQRDQLLDARALEHDGLSNTVKERMRPIAQNCLRLESQVAAVEAVEWLANSLDPLAEGGTSRIARRAGVDVEIERLMSSANRQIDTEEGVEPASAGGGVGGPVEELAEDEGGPAGRLVETTTRVNYRSGPSTDARRLGTLPEGADVVLLGEAGDWANILLGSGASVYIASAYLRDAR